jgi:dTDP-4-amino-4,6-dideoxygalactose transaminase
VKLLRHHGLSNRDACEVFGYNSRLDTLQAIVADAMLDHLDAVTKTRVDHAAFYDGALAGLAPDLVVPPRRPGVRQVFHTYVVQVERRAELVAHLAARGIETKIHYPIPIHLQRAAAHLGHARGSFPVCERQADRILSLPVHEFLEESQLAYVAETITHFYGR